MYDRTRDEQNQTYTRITEWLPVVKQNAKGQNLTLDADVAPWRHILERLGVRYLIKQDREKTALFAHNQDYAGAAGVDLSDKSLWEN